MGSSIQFRGRRSVVKAFDNFDADAWAIFCAKNLLFKGTDSGMLESILQEMEPSGSDAVYQLKVYEGIDDVKRIKDNTPADGSFFFKLGEEGSFLGGKSQYVRDLEDRIKKMEEGDDDEDKSIGGRIGSALLGLLEQPNELVSLIGTLKNMFQPAPQGVAAIGKVTADFAPPMYTQPMPVSSVPVISEPQINVDMAKGKGAQPAKPAKENVNEISEDQKILRLSAAITTLETNDADVLLHLEKLAKISAENPQMFKMLITTLDNFE